MRQGFLQARNYAFISYPRRDFEIEFVRRFKQAAASHNIDIWQDKEMISPGDYWTKQIENGISDAGVVAVVISQESVKSHWVTYEWAFASGKNIPIIPLLLMDPHETNIHPGLHLLQGADCRTNEMEGFKNAFGIMENHLDPDIQSIRDLKMQLFRRNVGRTTDILKQLRAIGTKRKEATELLLDYVDEVFLSLQGRDRPQLSDEQILFNIEALLYMNSSSRMLREKIKPLYLKLANDKSIDARVTNYLDKHILDFT